jgi:hypothetical protein
MRIRVRLAVPVILALMVAPSMVGEAAPAASLKEVKIRQLLQLTGAAQLGTQMMDQMMASFKASMPEVPAEFWSEFRREVKPGDLENLIVPIYSKHLSDLDLDGLIAFYSSPLGQKLSREMPSILQESVVVGQAWGRGLAQKAADRLQQKGYKPAA